MRMCDKLTILYVASDSTMGGSTASLWNLIKSVALKVQPIVLFPEKGNGYSFFVKQGIECYIHSFVRLYNYPANNLSSNYPRWWAHLKKNRIDLGCALSLKKKLKDRRIDIVHSNTSPINVGIYLAKVFRAKHVWHVRECLDVHDNSTIYGGIQRLRLKILRADARIAISEFVKNHWGLNVKRTYVIHDAVRSIQETVLDVKKEKRIVFVSYYVTEAKGARLAVKAFGESRLQKEGFILQIIGNCSSEYQASLTETAKEYDCINDVVFFPLQLEVKPFLANAAALIMASRYEGMGRVTVEAMFYGCPVVAHASGGSLDLIVDGKTGLLFKSVQECAACLRKVCFDVPVAMIKSAQCFAKEELSEECYGSKIMEVYRAVLPKI